MGFVTRHPEAMRRGEAPLAGRPGLRLIVNANASAAHDSSRGGDQRRLSM
jgi:hypothetical protein